MRRLKVLNFVDPFSLKGFDAEVSKDGCIHRNGMSLSFARGEELPQGQKVHVFVVSGHFYCETLEERVKGQKLSEDKQKLRIEESKREKNRRRKEAEDFNSTLKIPVSWEAGIKDVLSGLSESSNGDARYSRTVHHVLLKDDLKLGRLFREKGQFLCGELGKNWSNMPEEVLYDGNDSPYTPKITCKACLKIAERLRKNNDEEETEGRGEV